MWPDGLAFTHPLRQAATSYPFLRCAQRLGLPYGLVLAFRSAALKTVMARGTWQIGGMAEDLFGTFDYWEIEAAKTVGASDGQVIIDTIKAEEERRARHA